MMGESILNDVKMLCGVPEDIKDFDGTLILHCNGVFSTLNQIGFGPDEGYYIYDSNDSWSDILEDGEMQYVKSYLYLKVKLLFDPPANATLIASMEKQIAEFEWRIKTEIENRSSQI